jgi:hypothetical protein
LDAKQKKRFIEPLISLNSFFPDENSNSVGENPLQYSTLISMQQSYIRIGIIFK